MHSTDKIVQVLLIYFGAFVLFLCCVGVIYLIRRVCKKSTGTEQENIELGALPVISESNGDLQVNVAGRAFKDAARLIGCM